MVLVASSVVVLYVCCCLAGLWYAWWTCLLLDVHVSNSYQQHTSLRSQALQVLLLLQLECMFVA